MEPGQIAQRLHKEITSLTANERRTIVNLLNHHKSNPVNAGFKICKLLKLNPDENYKALKIITNSLI